MGLNFDLLEQIRLEWEFSRIPTLITDSPKDEFKSMIEPFTLALGNRLGITLTKGSIVQPDTPAPSSVELVANSYHLEFGLSLVAIWMQSYQYGRIAVISKNTKFTAMLQGIWDQLLPTESIAERIRAVRSSNFDIRSVLLLCDTAINGPSYDPDAANTLCHAWNTGSEALRHELVWAFGNLAAYWRDFYPLLKHAQAEQQPAELAICIEAVITSIESVFAEPIASESE